MSTEQIKDEPIQQLTKEHTHKEKRNPKGGDY